MVTVVYVSAEGESKPKAKWEVSGRIVQVLSFSNHTVLWEAQKFEKFKRKPDSKSAILARNPHILQPSALPKFSLL